MSDNELYRILKGFRSASAEEVYKPLEEDLDESQTKIEKMGNKVRVTKDGDTTEFDDEETAAMFMGGDEEEMQEDVEEVAEDDAEEVNEEQVDEEVVDETEQLDEFLPALAAVGGGLARAAATGAGSAFGAAAADKVFGEGDEPEFSTFDSDNPSHRKALQRGTPVVLSPEVCSDPKGDRTGVFLNMAKSGFFGKVMRNCDGKQINVHLSDIVSADITNNSIYESFNADFDKLMEEITVTTTQNPESPENDTMTVTGVGPEAVDELAGIMANAGLSGSKPVDTPVDAVVDTGEPEVGPEEPQELNASCGSMHEDKFPSDSDIAILRDPDFDLENYDEYDLSPEMHDEISKIVDFYSHGEGHGTWDDVWNVIEKDILEGYTTEAAGAYDFQDEMETELTGDDGETTPGTVSFAGNIVDGKVVIDPTSIRASAHHRDGNSKLGFDDDFDTEMFLGDQYGMEELQGYAEEKYGQGVGEARDINYANTPDEEFAKLQAIIQGLAGGLNKPKKMYKKEYPGDNNMAVEEGDTEYDDEEARRPSRRADKGLDGPNYEFDSASGLGHDDEEMNETESFLNLYKTFTQR